MLKRYDIITIGGVARDIIFFTDKGRVIDNKDEPTCAKLACFESGAKITVEAAYFGLGGGAANTAVTLARLGFKPGVIAKTGKDKEAEKIFEDLESEGVDTSLIDQDKRTGTGFSFIVGTGKAREHTAFLYRGANDELQVNDPLLSGLETRWIYVTSLSGNNWSLVLRNVIKYTENSKFKPGTGKRAEGVKLAWNPGQMQIEAGKRAIERFLGVTDVLILNRDEARELVLSDKKSVKSEAQIKNEEFLLRTIQSFGPEMVVITCGEEGAYAISEQEIYFKKAKKVKSVDTTGAGDAFGASFVAGLILFKDDIEKTLDLAVVNSAAVVTRVGAQDGLLRANSLLKF